MVQDLHGSHFLDEKLLCTGYFSTMIPSFVKLNTLAI